VECDSVLDVIRGLASGWAFGKRLGGEAHVARLLSLSVHRNIMDDFVSVDQSALCSVSWSVRIEAILGLGGRDGASFGNGVTVNEWFWVVVHASFRSGKFVVGFSVGISAQTANVSTECVRNDLSNGLSVEDNLDSNNWQLDDVTVENVEDLNDWFRRFL